MIAPAPSCQRTTCAQLPDTYEERAPMMHILPQPWVPGPDGFSGGQESWPAVFISGGRGRKRLQQPNLLATADAQGFVKVWRLSTHLSTMAANELQALEKLAATTVRTADTRASEAGGGDEEDGGYGDDDFE